MSVELSILLNKNPPKMSKKRKHEDGEIRITISDNDRKIFILKREIKDLEEKHSQLERKYLQVSERMDKIVDLIQEYRLENGLKKLILGEDCSYIS